MFTVVNKTQRPLKVHLPQGKILHLGPRMKGQISPHVRDSAGVQKLVEAGDLEVLDGRETAGTGGAASGSIAPDTHGHHPHTTVRKRGDR